MRIDAFMDMVDSKTQSPAGKDGKIDRSEMAAAFAAIEQAHHAEKGQLFFDLDSAQWRIV